MKLFQIALLLFNVIPVAKSADKPTPETFDVFWTKSRTESETEDQDPQKKPKYERRSNFLLIDSVDEFKDIEFKGMKQKGQKTPHFAKKALDSIDEVMFEGLANDLQIQTYGMKAMVRETFKQSNESIQKKAEKDPMDDKLPLQLKIEGDFSVTFSGLKLTKLLEMLKMGFPDGVNPDRIWGQLRIVPDVKTRTDKIVEYIEKQTAHIEGIDVLPTQATRSGPPKPKPRKGGEDDFKNRNETM